MQNAPNGPADFPFPAAEGDAKAKTETENRLQAGAEGPPAVASGRRVTVLEQFIRNRPESKGAKMLGIMDRVRALFKNPHDGPRDSNNPSLQRGISLYRLLEAIMGQRPENAVIDRVDRRMNRGGDETNTPPPPPPAGN
jgi:hypothetical protein